MGEYPELLAGGWKQALGDELEQPYMQQLRTFLVE